MSDVEPMPTEPDAVRTEGPPRLRSLDALRGFDMLWIVGGHALVQTLARYTE